MQPSANIHLLHDTVHLFKSIRNNWITEKSGTLKLIFEGSQYIGKWSDIVKLYECEKGDMIRRTKLSHAAVYPGPIDRQKVSLMTQVFDEKTVAALRMDGSTASASSCLEDGEYKR